MNLATTIEVFCGGPGSGCRGENCGRPRLYETFDREGRKIHVTVPDDDERGVSVSELPVRDSAKIKKFETGVPVRMRAYHVTTPEGTIKYGNGGAFFSPDVGGEYGTRIMRATLTLKNPLVVGDQIDAAHKLMSPTEAAHIEDLFEKETMEGHGGFWSYADPRIASAARAKGYDSLIYTDPSSLTSKEFVVLERSAISKVRKYSDVDVWQEKELRKMQERGALAT